MITEQQYRRLMKHYRKNGGIISEAASKAGIHRQTATRYLKAKKSPAELKQQRAPRTYRTRQDPLGPLWDEAQKWLTNTPEVETKMLFEHLLAQHPQFAPAAGALRTFYRRVAQWRAHHGPALEVSFPQDRAPGECLQFDWTRCFDLGVTIAGQPYPHLLAHAVLPYSNWEWAVPCRSESALSLKRGVQEALWELGGVPPVLQTDQSSTATHQLKRSSPVRGFNSEYLAFCKHLGMQPRTIHVHCPDENGDVESLNGHLKRRLKSHLMLRGSRDFASEAEYAEFVAAVCRALNARRTQRLAEERPHFKPLPRKRFPETQEVTARVSSASTVRVKGAAYSVPSRLRGLIVQAHLSETEVKLYHAGKLVMCHRRSQGKEPRIDYRHIITALAKKPGAFKSYLYREQLFPSIVFRQAHERLLALEERKADARYIKLLTLAATEGEAAVEEAIGACLRIGEPPLVEAVHQRLQARPSPTAALHSISPYEASLAHYDALLEVNR